jgi:hypothetical protein
MIAAGGVERRNGYDNACVTTPAHVAHGYIGAAPCQSRNEGCSDDCF